MKRRFMSERGIVFEEFEKIWGPHKRLLFETTDRRRFDKIVDIFQKHGAYASTGSRMLKRRNDRKVYRVYAYVTKDVETNIRKDVAALSRPFSLQ